MSFSIQYHILIVGGLTLIGGSILRQYYSIHFSRNSWADKFCPYAIVYFPLAIIYVFITDELPLTGFSLDPVYDTNDSPSLGPQSISGDAILALIITIGSILINILVWIYSAFLTIRCFIKCRQNKRANPST